MSIYSTPYTYHIAWSSIDKHYYGVRHAKNCSPEDLWKTYFTSSKVVKKYREKYGEPDIIEVRKVFDDRHKALLWESKVLKKLNVLHNDKWLNENISGDQFIIQEHSQETKRKMSENNASKRPEMRQLISKNQSGKNNSFYGKKHTAESNEKRRQKLLGIKRTQSFREERMGDKNVSKRPDVRKKISEATKGKPKRKRERINNPSLL